MKSQPTLRKNLAKKPSLMILLLFLCCLIAACGAAPTGSGGGSNEQPTATSTTPAQQNATPTPTPRPLPAEPLISIRFLDQSRGWGLTKHAVLRTSDGGKSWQDVSPQAPAGKNWLTMNLFGLAADL